MASSESKTLKREKEKEGERVIAPTRRPDGTLRKQIRIRDGYTPPDEVPVYKSKGALLKESSANSLPPGYDPEVDVVVTKPKSKSAKRNEKKREKRDQQDKEKGEGSTNGELVQASGPIDSVVSQIKEITISKNPAVASPPLNSTDGPATGDHVPDIDKRIRALKKKIRLTEAQEQKTGNDMKPELLEKVAKLDEWRRELKVLEDKKASLEAL